MNGILLVNKPTGISSGKLSRVIKRKFSFKKVGHGGTLDPLATGVLPILVNRGTKLAETLLGADKEYTGIFLLGRETDTQDVTGKITSQDSKEKIQSISDDQILQQMKKNEGIQSQCPPMYSAVKVKGKPLYKYARKNIEVERKPREVQIFKFEMTHRDQAQVSFHLHCSKGTYVRTLCHDLGKQLGTHATIESLCRVRSGPFEIKDAIKLDALRGLESLTAPHWKPV